MTPTDFPDYFADAESEITTADFVLYGVPYERYPSFRSGVAKAPLEIRKASWNFETFDIRTAVDIKDIAVHDYGDLGVGNLDDNEMISLVETFSSTLINKSKFPIAIGGSHSITPGIIQSFPRDTAVLFLDAHMDYRQSYEGSIYNHACALRRVVDHVGVDNVAMLGVRSVEYEEYVNAKKDKIFYQDSFLIQKYGIKKSIEQTKQYLEGKKIYITLDSDVIDPSFAPATGTPEPYGLTPFDIVEVIEAFSSDIIGFDLVEVCPGFDFGETSILAAKIIRQIIGLIWNKQYND
ncbi:MAG: agmatinase [Thermoplasmatota archaeon]